MPSRGPFNPPPPPLDAEPCFLAHRATVYRWATTLGADHQTALDIVQETFLRLLRAAPRFESAAAQVGWLRRVCANLTADHRRARSVARLVAEPAVAAGRGDPDADTAARAMDHLSEMQRLVLVCKLADNLTFAQIASQLDLAVPTVKTHYLRALTAIRNHLNIEAPTPPSPPTAPATPTPPAPRSGVHR